jgi:hypothetical protein
VVVNVVDYGWGSKAHIGIGSTEFYAAVTVDVAFGVLGVGTGALFVGVLLFMTTGGAGPAAVLCAYVLGQVAFSIVSVPLREPAVRGVNRFYRELGHGHTVPEELGLGWSGALLR